MKLMKRIRDINRGSLIALIVSGCVFIICVILILALKACPSSSPVLSDMDTPAAVKPTETLRIIYTEATVVPYTETIQNQNMN
ncbi:MAG: hypothetical protein CW338_08300 [Clostridiales bacterium]|nr:hypothetical protein [Clostridiales bacterium]